MRQKELAVIEKIHKEFDTAQELILNQAIEIIQANTVNAKEVEKADLMKKLGFTGSEFVKETAEKLENQIDSREMADLVMDYKNTYPFLKFLTEDKLDEICEKYELIYAPVSFYKKNVPDKNLMEIANAQPLKSADEFTGLFTVTKIGYGEDDFKRFLKIKGKKEPVFTNREVIDSHNKYYGHSPSDWLFGETSSNMVFYSEKKELGLSFSIERYEEDKREGLFIAAPKTHFGNLKKLSKKNRFGFMKVFETEIKDPIVFRYVNGGIQVLSKWGVEGEDPALTLGIMN